jgi:hypothetical protein
VPFYQTGGRTRIVTNAGGLDPERCAQACADLLRDVNLARLKIAVVTGDDVLPFLKKTPGEFPSLETKISAESIAPRLVTANAYAGADPIARAIEAGADIVITGRVADPSLTVGPCIAHFGWRSSDYDPIAGATIAGHLIECGTQACGGFSTDWLDLPDNHAIGFPIVEVSADGSCVVTKPSGTGGAVNVVTVKEQLLYEIGDPGNYLSPDVTASLLTLKVEAIGENRVRVSGASGRPPTESLKVSATFRDGYKAHGMLTIFGHDAVKKARQAGEGVLRRLKERGCVYRDTLVECLGTGASVRGIVSRVSDTHLIETVLRVSVAGDNKDEVEQFTKEIAPLVTCGPQGVTGYASGRAKVLPIFGYWPTLISKSLVKPSWKLLPALASKGRS